ncbi:MAG TPA: M6 family metalloprotease domain-containing protein [Tahibacter sp.]|nr:M6 family metalloprotease domain-containing protein [Tahibacter sp.]
MSTRKPRGCAHPHRHGDAVWSDFCAVAPSPELKQRLKAELAQARRTLAPSIAASVGLARSPRVLGFNDGVIVPPDAFPAGTPQAAIRAVAAERAPLRGAVRVIVVLVDFSDRAMAATAAHFSDLFFSTGKVATGSVREYYREASGGVVDIVGEVVGPLRMPRTLAWYANGNFGIGRPSGTIRARDLAHDAAKAANAAVNFAPYDNDGNGFVDAFVVVHAGSGGEATGDPGDIWSHKYTLANAYDADGKKIYAYLTIPEDARIGVSAHELGHLLFGFPDLYDEDSTSEGVGNWCLMGGGSWNGGGDTPAHPSAWCKANQGWVGVTNVTADGVLSLPDVKTSRNVHRLWKDGAGGPEYFLLENRQRAGFDRQLPGDGLLIWHIDEGQPGNTDENRYKVALVQADGRRDLEGDANRGDAGDPYPGTNGNTSFNATSTPSSKAYSGQGSCVSVTQISASAATMTAKTRVSCGKTLAQEVKRPSDKLKDGKDFPDTKFLKDLRDTRLPLERPGGFASTPTDDAGVQIAQRLATIEALLGIGTGEPFIDASLRPEVGGPPDDEHEDCVRDMAAGDRDAKRSFDTLPPR